MNRRPQSKKSSRRVGELVDDPSSSLHALLRHASQLEALQTLLRDRVGADLSDRFQVAAVRKNRLIIVTPSASWATRFRMHAPRMLQSLESAGVTHIRHIDIRIAPLAQSQTTCRRKRDLSPAARQALDTMRQLSVRKKSRPKTHLQARGRRMISEKA